MPETRRLIIAGHSHTMALGVPAMSVNDDHISLEPIPFARNAYGLVGPPPRGMDYWTVLTSVAAGCDIAVCWQGNLHLGIYLIRSKPFFDFMLSSNPELACEPQCLLVPESQIEATFAGYMEELSSILSMLESVPKCRILVLGSPPPRASDEAMRETFLANAWFANHARQAGIDVTACHLMPVSILAKMHRLIERNVAALAQDKGFSYLAAPPSTVDNDGYLLEEYIHGLGHGNAKYGLAVLNQIRIHFAE